MSEQEADLRVAAGIARLELRLALALPEELRQRVLVRLAQGEGVWTAEMIATIPESTEPGFVFQPCRRSGASPVERGN